MLHKTLKRLRRKNRIRSKISGTELKPRLAVYRSNTNIYAQLIDDTAGKTLTSFSDLKLDKAGTKTEMSKKVGEEMAKKVLDLKITEIVFDRGGFAYHGRVKALAEALRAGGLKF
ncbi:MAG: 50S ribosomal protein L18 [Candidatus Gracilibacteria bacterium]|nr:50S ribosomal protein L18 [Candidatus Gracilibacteria bacterium]